MRIAFVYDAVYPWIKGGAEKRIYETGKILAKDGNDVHLYGIKWWEGEDVITYEGMTLHGVCDKMELYVRGKRSVKEALIFSAKLFFPLKKEKYDIIDVSVFPYFSCFTAKIVSYSKKTPVVFTWHEFWGDYWYEYMGRKGFLGKIIEKSVYYISSRNVAVSEMTAGYLQHQGRKKKDIEIINNGIDTGFIEKVPPSAEKYHVIFAGRLIREKHVDMLLQAVRIVKKEVPDIRACIIGEGPEEQNLKDCSNSLGLGNEVDFKGFLDYSEVISLMKSSGIFVLPSSREGFGIVVVEAFACGCPVITVNKINNSARYLVDENCGFVTESDPEDIARAILGFLNNEKLYIQMSENAVIKSGEYNWENIAQKSIRLYRNIIGY